MSASIKGNAKQFTELVGKQWKGTTVIGKLTLFLPMVLGLLVALIISYIILVYAWFDTTGSRLLHGVFFKVR